jgi:hypothetical protein
MAAPLAAAPCATVRHQRVQPHRLHRHLAEAVIAELAAALGFAHAHPVGRLIPCGIISSTYRLMNRLASIVADRCSTSTHGCRN